MATTARLLTRLPTRASPVISSIKSSRAPFNNLPRTTFQSTSRRAYASGPGQKSSNTSLYIGAALAIGATAGGYFYLNSDKDASGQSLKSGSSGEKAGLITPTQKDYQAVYNEVAKRLEEQDEYDDGSYGPVIVRLAWHSCGTYDVATNTGGSNGATMRFPPEGDHGANAGLKAARDFLEPVKQKFPWISYADLWTLAGVTAIQEMQGPVVPWRPGRSDRDVSFCTPDGRLPDGAKGKDHLRAIFGRMGFDDREIVALSGAHALGRCHTDRSGFEGPWTFSPTIVSNDYYRLLVDDKWGWRKWNGPKQYEDLKTKTLMMLPTDMALVQDKIFKAHVERYAASSEAFFKEFSDVLVKLMELGVPFQTKERMEFKPSQA